MNHKVTKKFGKSISLNGTATPTNQSLSRSDATAATLAAKKLYLLKKHIPTKEGSQNKCRTACLSNEMHKVIEIASEFQFARIFAYFLVLQKVGPGGNYVGL